MKKLVKFVTLICIVSLIGSSLIAQTDTLVVPAIDDEGKPIKNALVKYVEADTNVAGEQLHDVYKLKKGEIYYTTQGISTNNDLKIVADKPGETSETKPPQILGGTNEKGQASGANIVSTYGDITFKNIAICISSPTSSGWSFNWNSLVIANADSINITLEGLYMASGGSYVINTMGTKGIDIKIDRCHFRNMTTTQTYLPNIVMTRSTSTDTILMRNSTVFNKTGRVMSVVNPANYVELDHNTFANIHRGLWPNWTYHQVNDVKITNNVFYNTRLTTNSPEYYENQANWGMNSFSSIIHVDTLDNNTIDTVEASMPESERKYVVKKNNYYWSEEVKNMYERYNNTKELDYFTLDTLVSETQDTTIDTVYTPETPGMIPPTFMSDQAKKMFNDNSTYANFVAENNINENPNFERCGGVKQLIKYNDHYQFNKPQFFWGWDPDSTEFPDKHFVHMQWPLPEDLSHELSMKGTNGLHLGSLEYYPNEMKEYYEEPVSIEDNTANSQNSFELKNNYPNPFNPTTTIEYSLKNNMNVKLSVYNVVGQKVKTLVNSSQTPGNHSVKWKGLNESGKRVSSGIYFYKLRSGSNVKMKKMILLK